MLLAFRSNQRPLYIRSDLVSHVLRVETSPGPPPVLETVVVLTNGTELPVEESAQAVAEAVNRAERIERQQSRARSERRRPVGTR